MQDLLPILNAADQWAVSSTALRIMLHLHQGDTVRPSKLGRSLNLTPAGVGSSVKTLVKRGIVRKQRNPADRDERGIRLTLLPYGQRMLEAILAGNHPPDPQP